MYLYAEAYYNKFLKHFSKGIFLTPRSAFQL